MLMVANQCCCVQLSNRLRSRKIFNDVDLSLNPKNQIKPEVLMAA
jgi:hypothetical protein